MKRRALTIAVAAYVVLLAASHATRALRHDAPTVDEPTVEVGAVDNGRPAKGQVRLAYLDAGPAEPESTLVLLHGSPGSVHDFDGLLPTLERRHRVVAPDLPGFGESTRDVPDYSIRAHADYVLELLDRLGLDRVDVVGFSMGGGVAIELAVRHPDRVRSLTLLSGVGVQELELFGDYRLNHAVHGIQLAGLWLLREAVPHFGTLDDTFVGVPYARNFYDTDQRPLRAMLSRLRQPTLIVHGDEDFLVPPEAAIEHHRIVPQSRLEMLHGSHFMVFLRGPELAGLIDAFLDDVAAGRAPDRAHADPARIAAAARPFDPSTLPELTGMALVVMLLLIVAATLVSEDLTCIMVGLMVGQGRIGFLSGVLACITGIFIGDILLFVAGRIVGRPAIRRRPLRWLIGDEQVEAASVWFRRRGPVVILLSRFLPGARTPTYFAAGLLRTGFWSFSFYFLAAVAIWTPLLVGAASLLGRRAAVYWERLSGHALLGALLFGVWILVVSKFLMPLFTRRGRRRWVGRWRRTVNWEFWPPWAFYPPVALWILWLGIRYRSPLVFTAANPAMPAGGFIAESKQEILAGLSGAGPFVAAGVPVPATGTLEDRVRRVRDLVDRCGGFPVVLKPDAGQRGSGVAVIRDPDGVRRYLERADFDVIAQQYVPGHELGIFYARRPGDSRGRIISITDKRLPEVVGDGERTLEQLIFDDPRAVCMADHYIALQHEAASRIPGMGQHITLVELGTHCRGAIFLDGAALWSEPLEARIDEIARGYDGFYFGRFDVRAPDLDRLRRGEGFRIIELNGVTSEATHVYDPETGLFGAWRTLCRQWSLCFEIGAVNRRAGHRPASLDEMLGLIRSYRRASRAHEPAAAEAAAGG